MRRRSCGGGRSCRSSSGRVEFHTLFVAHVRRTGRQLLDRKHSRNPGRNKRRRRKKLFFTFLSVTQREVEKPWETNIGSSHQELNKTKTTKKNPSGLVDARPGVAISAKTLHEPVTQPSI